SCFGFRISDLFRISCFVFRIWSEEEPNVALIALLAIELESLRPPAWEDLHHGEAHHSARRRPHRNPGAVRPGRGGRTGEPRFEARQLSAGPCHPWSQA